jgi:hypothetical protein
MVRISSLPETDDDTDSSSSEEEWYATNESKDNSAKLEQEIQDTKNQSTNLFRNCE